VATRKEKVDAGLFLLIGVLLLSGTIALVAGVNLERKGDLFVIRIPKSVGGLREGSVVKYLGVNVGRVKEVDFPAEDVESVRVAVEITRSSTPIKSGTFATLSSNFLTGETSIELQGGTNEEGRLHPGSLITWRPTTFMRLEDSLPGVLDEIKKAVANLNGVLSAENQQRLARMIDDFDRVATETAARLGPLAEDAHSLRESLSATGERIAVAAAGLREEVTASISSGVTDLKSASKSVESVAGKLERVADRLGEGADGLPEIVASIGRLTARLDRVLSSADLLVDDNREELRRALLSLQAASREFEELVAQLRRNPSDLIFSEPRSEHARGERPAPRPAKEGS